MVDYPCGKFDDCSFSRFGSILRTNTHTQTDVDERFNLATLVSVSNNPTSRTKHDITLVARNGRGCILLRMSAAAAAYAQCGFLRRELSIRHH